jgi:hypothetical protein
MSEMKKYSRKCTDYQPACGKLTNLAQIREKPILSRRYGLTLSRPELAAFNPKKKRAQAWATSHEA